MKLANPGAGEISDRLTILQLKILFGTEANRDVTAFKTERTALLSQIRSRTLNGVWFDTVIELAAVNAAIWHAEDDLRALRQQHAEGKVSDWDAALRCACRPQTLNDQRAALVEKINRDAGDGGSAEKSFAKEER